LVSDIVSNAAIVCWTIGSASVAPRLDPVLAGSCKSIIVQRLTERSKKDLTLDTKRLMSTVTIFCSPVNPAMFFLPIAAALVDWPGLLKLANLTSCVDDDADIDGRGREVALLLCRSIPAAVLSSRDEEGWEEETVMAGEVESLLL
jgi:hypothetical protein